MKKKGKSLLAYLFILIGIALGVFVVCIAVLVLSPGKDIAGFVYSKVSTNDVVYARMITGESVIRSESYFSQHLGAQTKQLGANDVQSIVINAGAHDVVVRQMKQDQRFENGSLVNAVDKFAFVISSQYSGIYKHSKYPNGVDFNIQYDASTKKLTLNFQTPNGLNFNRAGNIIVDLPEAFYYLANSVKTSASLDASNCATLKVVSDKGAVNLGGWNETGSEVRPSSIPNVDISTDSGDITLNQNFYACGQTLRLQSKKGKITNENAINQKDMKINLSSDRGEVNFADLTASELNIYSKKADVRLGNVDLGSSTNAIKWSGDYGRLFANDIKGSIRGGEDASASNFDIKYISGEFYLPKGDTCDVNIEKIDGKVKIVSKNNNISIKEATSEVVIQTQKGNVKLENCSGIINVTSTRAPVTLTNCSGQIRVKTNKGKISGSISGLDGTDNSLNTDKSSIDIKFDQNMKFILSASSSKKNVSIDYAAISDSKKDFKNILINGGDEATKITISAKNEVSISNI